MWDLLDQFLIIAYLFIFMIILVHRVYLKSHLILLKFAKHQPMEIRIDQNKNVLV